MDTPILGMSFGHDQPQGLRISKDISASSSQEFNNALLSNMQPNRQPTFGIAQPGDKRLTQIREATDPRMEASSIVLDPLGRIESYEG